MGLQDDADLTLIENGRLAGADKGSVFLRRVVNDDRHPVPRLRVLTDLVFRVKNRSTGAVENALFKHHARDDEVRTSLELCSTKLSSEVYSNTLERHSKTPVPFKTMRKVPPSQEAPGGIPQKVT